jgi:hypothetical protein
MSEQNWVVTVNVAELLDEEYLAKLHEHMAAIGKTLPEVIQDGLYIYVDRIGIEHPDDTPDDQVLEGLRQGLLDAFAGRTRPAREAMEELRLELEAEELHAEQG